MHEAKLMNGKRITVRSDKGFIAADIMSSRIRGRNDINAWPVRINIQFVRWYGIITIRILSLKINSIHSWLMRFLKCTNSPASQGAPQANTFSPLKY